MKGKTPSDPAEIRIAFLFAVIAMVLLFVAAQQVKLWDLRAFQTKIERVFAVGLTAKLPPPSVQTQSETAKLAGKNSVGDPEKLFAERPDNPAGAAPELTLAALPPPPTPSPNALSPAMPSPDLPGMTLKASAPDIAPPAAIIALRRQTPPAALPETGVSIRSGAYRPAAPAMPSSAASLLPAVIPEITPEFAAAETLPPLPAPAMPEAVSLFARDLLRARPAEGYPSLEKDLTARLEYSPPLPGEASRCFKLSFSLRPESTLPPLPKDVLFLIDVSQSIEGRQIKAMHTAIAEYISGLRPGDRWNVVKFSERLHSLSSDFSFFPAGDIPPEFARFFSRPPNEYMTDLFAATQAVLEKIQEEERPCNVFLLTDGFATYGRREVDQLVRGFRRINRDKFSLMTFMLGDKGMGDLLRLLAYRSRGFFRQQNDEKQAAAEMLDFFRAYDRPVLFACVANFSDLRGEDVYPAVLPNLYHGQEVAFFGRAELTAAAVIRVVGWGNGNQPREFYFRPEQNRIYPTGDQRIRTEWAYGAAMEHVQGIIEAPDKETRTLRLTELRKFCGENGLTELHNMADLIGKNQ